MRICVAVLIAFSLLISIACTSSAESSGDFFKGKTIQFTVGYPAGGGLDIYARAVARFMGKHIPGNPNVVVVNMPGASSLAFVRFLRVQAPRDGTQFGMFDSGLIPKSILDPQDIGVDFRDFGWIGNMNREVGVCYMDSRRSISSIEDILASPNTITIGGTSKSASGYTYGAILQRLSPRSIKFVLGYDGTFIPAIERGEIDGNCNLYSYLETAASDLLAEGKIKVVVQFSRQPHPELKNVKTIYDYLKTDDEKQAVNFLTSGGTIGRPVIAPPQVPLERLSVLRRAFMDTMNDPEFIAFAKQIKMDVDVLDGQATTQIVNEIVDTPPEALTLARQILE